ncbi:stage III sporulation protein AD [Natroniella sulfidigena]|uniref:stage III sporulation protein AD n=1 Tax=Natroniella sulfidigena TaxID=723921 RepID=UPI0024A617C1|nr:stage III sporulation protein AD [Natroniella sulfidigena]
MEIVQVVGLGLIGTIFTIVVKQYRPELALQLSLVVGLIIFILMVDRIAVIVDVMRRLAEEANIDLVYVNTILKVIGIAYIAEFGAQICRDAGENIIASKIEFAGKIMIMVLGVPIMISILESILQLLP